MRNSQDAYGRAMLDHLDGLDAWEIVEREDGTFSLGAGPELYLAPFRAWRSPERRAMRFVRGRVLDVGCGAGRAALHLQDRGLDVIGIDTSPGAIEASRLRGVREARIGSLHRLPGSLGTFDTVVMLGGGLGLLGTPERARPVLRRLHRITSDRGRIIGASRDRTKSEDPDDMRSVRRNLRLGELSGQSRLRIRYRRYVTPWFDFFRITPAELEGLLEETGWRIHRILEDDATYVAVIDKAPS